MDTGGENFRDLRYLRGSRMQPGAVRNEDEKISWTVVFAVRGQISKTARIFLPQKIGALPLLV